MKKTLLCLIFLSVLAGCATYYDPFDDYVLGLRLFDRGAFEQAKNHWEPVDKFNIPLNLILV